MVRVVPGGVIWVVFFFVYGLVPYPELGSTYPIYTFTLPDQTADNGWY
jgi:hypothetical protein